MTALGWVNAVTWSPTGTSLAFCAHDSSMHVATFNSDGSPVVQTLRFRELPYKDLIFISESALIAGGHDFNPKLFGRSSKGSWSAIKQLDEKKDDKSSVSTSGVSAARQLFQNKTRSGQDSKSENDTLWTLHDNAITCISNASVAGGQAVRKISSSGLDGRFVIWDIDALEINLGSLSL